MAWFEREFIAVPEDRKNQLVYKWPDINIRRFTRVIVNADEVALFVKSGRVAATMGPGRHHIDADELPVLGALLDTLSGHGMYRAELYFVSGLERPGVKFGGPLADVVDPRSEQVVTLRVFGEFALTVRDPTELITRIAGTSDVADPARVESWCAEQLLKAMKVAVAKGISRGEWPILGLSAYLPQIESIVVRDANIELYGYGLRIPRMGNFDINLAPEDADRLKRLAKDTRYIELAGGFQNYAAGELALGAGHGMAHGNVTPDGGLLGAAFAFGAVQPFGAVQQSRSDQPAAAALEAVRDKCDKCAEPRPADAQFCPSCGARFGAQDRQECTGCQRKLDPTAKFCHSCGAPAAEQADSG